MPKVIAFLTTLFLAGSSQTVYVEMSPYETSITVPKELVEHYVDSPLSRHQWVMAQALQSVPLFKTGTSIEQVRVGLIDRNLLIRAEWPDYMVVREGVPLFDTSGPVRENYLYGFTNDELVLGPNTFLQVVGKFVREGMTPERMRVLHSFASVESDDAEPYNQYAWLLATYPDARFRNGQLAVEFAQRALSLSEVPEWSYVDTLAAAYAASGDFENAVEQQQRALALNSLSDEEAEKRLDLYRDRKAYTVATQSPEPDDESEEGVPKPKASLLRDAAAGSVDAQWSLGAFYIENDIAESDGITAPGVFWLEQAAQNGHPFAANEVGYCYMMSRCGVEQDHGEAVRWFQMSVESGDLTAALNLGVLLSYGWGAPRDDVEATRLLTIAANNGENAAAFYVAFRYGEGLGAPPNYAAQRKFLRQIESTGYGPADYLLDDIFFQRFYGAAAIAAALDRTYVRPDEMAEAQMAIVEVLENASAESDDMFTVQFEEGAIFEYPSDYGPYLIFSLVRISASLGSARAQYRMAEYFERGEIVSRSLIEAHYWRQRAEK